MNSLCDWVFDVYIKQECGIHLVIGKILFEDSNIEMRDSDDELFNECSQLYMENPILLIFNLDSGYENLPSSTSHVVIDHTESRRLICSDDVTASNEDAMNINSMPEEILMKIFGYFLHNELGQITRVCQKWNMLTKNSVLWKKVNAHFLSLDHQLQATAAECFINLLPACVTSLTLKFNHHFFRGAVPLHFEAISAKLKDKCPHLKMLKLCSAKLSYTLTSIINLCTLHLKNVRILLLHLCDFPLPECFDTDECVYISEIEILELYSCDLKYFDNPTFSRMPHLKDLRFVSTSVSDFWFVDEPSFLNQLHVLALTMTVVGSNTLQAIWNHAFNLKELYLCCTSVHDGYLNFNNSVFSNLQTVCLSDFWEMNGHHVVSLARSCQSLQIIYVNDFLFGHFDPFPVGKKCISEIVKENNLDHSHIM